MKQCVSYVLLDYQLFFKLKYFGNLSVKLKFSVYQYIESVLLNPSVEINLLFILIKFMKIYWTLDVSQTDSYEITVARLSIRL